jgi:hypothetical protein
MPDIPLLKVTVEGGPAPGSERARGYFSDDASLKGGTGLGRRPDHEKALAKLDEFLQRRSQGLWPHIRRTSLYNGLRARVEAPDRVHQRSTGLCGVVAMVRVWAHTFPEKYATFAIDLYERGIGIMAGGDTHSARRIQPSVSLRTANPPPGMSVADWIVAASIRESLNRVFNYAPGEGVFHIEAFTWPGDLAKQFHALGYTQVRGKFTPGRTQGYDSLMLASALYQRGWRVIMLIHARLFEGASAGLVKYPNHYAGLNSAIVRKISCGKPMLHPFQLWSAGRSQQVSERGGPIELDTVIGNYFGFVAGKF